MQQGFKIYECQCVSVWQCQIFEKSEFETYYNLATAFFIYCTSMVYYVIGCNHSVWYTIV